MHDPRIGRFFAVDPLTAKYPHNSPYAFSENDVIASLELEGLEKVPANEIWDMTGSTLISASKWYNIDLNSTYYIRKIHNQIVTLHEIKDGPNKGNYVGIVHNNGAYYNLYSNREKPKNYTYELKYVVGADKIKEKVDLGEVAADNLLDALSSDYEFSPTLYNVNNYNAYGVGKWNDDTGEWVSGSTEEQVKVLVDHTVDQLTDPLNYLPTPVEVNFRLKPGKGNWNAFRKLSKGTITKETHPNLTNKQRKDLRTKSYQDWQHQNLKVDPTSAVPSPDLKTEEKDNN